MSGGGDSSERGAGSAAVEGTAADVQAPIAYHRLYADEHGESRFEDVRLEGEPQGVIESDLRATFSDPFRATVALFRHVVDEADPARRHNTPCRQFIIQLAGECEVEASNGETRRLVPGSALLLEDVDGLGHTTRRIGDASRMTLVIRLDA